MAQFEVGRPRIAALLLLASRPRPPSRAELPGLDTLLTGAFAARPELRAVELAMEAAGRRAGVARSEILTLSALLDANGSGREGFEIGPGLALERPHPRPRTAPHAVLPDGPARLRRAISSPSGAREWPWPRAGPPRRTRSGSPSARPRPRVLSSTSRTLPLLRRGLDALLCPSPAHECHRDVAGAARLLVPDEIRGVLDQGSQDETPRSLHEDRFQDSARRRGDDWTPHLEADSRLAGGQVVGRERRRSGQFGERTPTRVQREEAVDAVVPLNVHGLGEIRAVLVNPSAEGPLREARSRYALPELPAPGATAAFRTRFDLPADGGTAGWYLDLVAEGVTSFSSVGLARVRVPLASE